MNFSDDDLRKIGVVNRFIVHSERTIDLFTDADKTYFLELYGRLSRCSGQDTIDKIAEKTLEELKIKGRDGTRCILVKPKTTNAFIAELRERGYHLAGQRPVVARTRRVRAAAPAAPAARRTRRVAAAPRGAFVVTPPVVRFPSVATNIESSSAVEDAVVQAPMNVGEEERILFGVPNIPTPPLSGISSVGSRVGAVQGSPRGVIDIYQSPPQAPYRRPNPVAVVPPHQMNHDEIIQVVRNTVQETIREYINAATPVAGVVPAVAVGGRRTMKHRRVSRGSKRMSNKSYKW